MSPVGSGSAGSVVAGRLADSSSPRFSVLLIEAGKIPSAVSIVPGFVLYGITQPNDITWNYKTTPQKYSQFGYKDQVSYNNVDKSRANLQFYR